MPEFIKGLDLCEAFFHECGLPVLQRHYPDLKYSAGLIGYGSDVLGFDDSVSTDHMWGPRFYLFLEDRDIHVKDALTELFATHLPYEYKGFSVNFSDPDPNDGGVRTAEFIREGKVSPLIWIYTIDEYINEYLGVLPENIFDWLSVSEHHLLGFTSGKLFVDMLDLSTIRSQLSFYPDDVKRYLIASQWDVIAEEQAFVKRCSDCDDETGSRIICARISERLMRLCFLYKNTYAPYSKWFGTGFKQLPIDAEIKNELHLAIAADAIAQREEHLVAAQVLVAGLHNRSHITEEIKVRVQKYFDRNIKVIFANQIAEKVKEKITNPILREYPLIGSISQIGNFVALSENTKYISNIQNLYKGSN